MGGNAEEEEVEALICHILSAMSSWAPTSALWVWGKEETWRGGDECDLQIFHTFPVQAPLYLITASATLIWHCSLPMIELDYALHHGDVVINGILYLKSTNSTE
jgi:hypothetical protein